MQLDAQLRKILLVELEVLNKVETITSINNIVDSYECLLYYAINFQY